MKKPSTFAQPIGSRVRSAREQADMTQIQLAEAIGSPQATISRIESGANQPKVETLRRIATALDVELSELLG